MITDDIMKNKLSTAVFLCAFLAAVTGCEKPNGGSDPVEPPTEEIVTLSISPESFTKTVLGEKDGDSYRVYWSEGDRIAVNGKRSEPLHTAGDSPVTADFSVSGVSAPFGVVYPSWICTDMTADAAEIEIQSIQKWTPNSFSSGAAVLYGWSSDSSVSLKNLCGVVRVNVDFGSYEIDRIQLTSLSTPIAGGFSLDLKTGELTPVNGSQDVEISIPSEGFHKDSGVSGNASGMDAASVDGDADGDAAVELNFCVPAGVYSEGFNLTITEKYGRKMVIELRENADVASGVITDWGSFNFVPSGSLIITDPDSWNSFAAAVNAGDYSEWKNEETGEVNVAANIITGGDLDQINNWDGVLNGGGYVITRNSISKPLFKTIASGAIVKNLKTGGLRTSIGSNSAATLAATNLGTIDNCENLAALTANVDAAVHFCSLVEANGGMMRGCVNSADFDIVLSYSTNREFLGGGIAFRPDVTVGDNTMLGTFEECKNTGNISIRKIATANSGLTKCAVGGILASAYAGKEESFVVLKNCTNEGNITLWENGFPQDVVQGAQAVGGIVGRIAPIAGSAPCFHMNPTPTTGFYTEITGCSNTGTIDVCSSIASGVSTTMTGARQCYIGGIAGIVVGLPSKPAKIASCTNSGRLLSGGTDKPCTIVGGILGGTAFTEISSCANSCVFGLTQNTLATPVTVNGNTLGSVAGIVSHILKVTPAPVISGCTSISVLPDAALLKGEIYSTGNKPDIK